jgi:hypothetical protein
MTGLGNATFCNPLETPMILGVGFSTDGFLFAMFPIAIVRAAPDDCPCGFGICFRGAGSGFCPVPFVDFSAIIDR